MSLNCVRTQIYVRDESLQEPQKAYVLCRLSTQGSPHWSPHNSIAPEAPGNHASKGNSPASRKGRQEPQRGEAVAQQPPAGGRQDPCIAEPPVILLTKTPTPTPITATRKLNAASMIIDT